MLISIDELDTPKKRAIYIRDHITYEWIQFLWTAYTLKETKMSGAIGNAIAESFLIHYRNLIDFLSRPPSLAKQGDVYAYNLVNWSKENWINMNSFPNTKNFLNKTVFHITVERLDPLFLFEEFLHEPELYEQVLVKMKKFFYIAASENPHFVSEESRPDIDRWLEGTADHKFSTTSVSDMRSFLQIHGSNFDD